MRQGCEPREVGSFWNVAYFMIMCVNEFCAFVRITDPSQKENLGIVVQYKVKVRLLLGFGSRWTLMHIYL